MPLNTCLAFTSSQLGELRLCASRGCCLCPKRCQWLLQELCSSGTMCFPKTPIHFTQCSIHKMPAVIYIDHHLSIPIVLVSSQRFHFFFFSPGFSLRLLCIVEAKVATKAVRASQLPTRACSETDEKRNSNKPRRVISTGVFCQFI